MKGLVLKDVYNVRFQIFTGMAIMMFPYLLLLISGGYDNAEDNILNEQIFGINGGIVVFVLLSYISITVNSSFMLNTIVDDKRSGWGKMQRTMPVSSVGIVGAKMAANGVIVGGLALIDIAVTMIGIFKLGLPPETLVAAPLVFGCLQMITLSVATVMGYRFGSVGTIVGYLLGVLVIAAGVVVLLYNLLTENLNATAFRVVCYAVIPALTAAVIAVCCNLGKKAVERDV